MVNDLPVSRSRASLGIRIWNKLRKFFWLILAIMLTLTGYIAINTPDTQIQNIDIQNSQQVTATPAGQSMVFNGFPFESVNFTFSMPAQEKVAYNIVMVDVFTSRVSGSVNYYHHLASGTADNGYTVQASETTDYTEYYTVNVSSIDGTNFNISVTKTITEINVLFQPLWLSYFAIAAMVAGASLGIVFISIKAKSEETGLHDS